VAERVAVVVADEQHDVALDAAVLAELARQVLTSEGATGELTLTFVDIDEITALNTEHMGIEAPTDVLSFPLDAEDDGMPSGAAVPRLLGDVVVCPAVAAAAAPSHAGTVADELALLVVHGVLHVLGYDHGEHDEAVAMRSRERALLEEHHWAGPAPAGFVHEQL